MHHENPQALDDAGGPLLKSQLGSIVTRKIMHFRQFLLVSIFMLAAFVPNLAAQDSCPVTTPSNPSFVPPVPYRMNAPQGAFWYGANDLWALLPVEGVWHLARQDNGGYFNKLFLWQEGYDWRKEPHPDIIVVLRRLDGNTPPITSRGGTNAFLDHSWAMLTGVLFPMEGCWEITSSHDGHSLTFVLSVVP